jgi:eukaryotic-like serine/threonine-protein kinase
MLARARHRSSSDTTTRTATLAGTPVVSGLPLLTPGATVKSPESGMSYRVERLLGQGGFGQVYLATRTRHSAEIPAVIGLKVSERSDGWIREAYFGQVLDGHARAIRLYDRFPLPRPDGTLIYCLVLEYAQHGDLSAYLRRTGQPFSELTARREIAGILEVLGKLHRGQTLHRDLTPMNVFVCDARRLKLGDFGITRHQMDTSGITVRTMNALTAPSDILDGAAPKWQARDDVYQVGQLLAMLIRGDAKARVRTRDVRQLKCSDQLKEIIYRCIGERRKRYEAADELIAALRTPPPALKVGAVRSLSGVHLAFTGILTRTRAEAAHAARRAGAVIHSGPSLKTTVIVRGKPNALQAAGKDGGLKLMEIKRLREKGHRITLLNETQFWKLVGARGTPRA